MNSDNRSFGLYAFGGTAANICAGMQDAVYFDTSDSNITKDFLSDSLYMVPATDGSGSVRGKNAEKIDEHLPKFFKAHPLAEFNVFVSSFTGGSGSYSICRALQLAYEQNKPVIVVGITGSTSQRHAENAQNVVKTMAGLVRFSGKPVIIAPASNQAEGGMKIADDVARNYINNLRDLVSGLNHGLDTEDLKNFMFFNGPSEHDAQVALLEITTGKEVPDRLRHAISTASILSDRYADRPNFGAGYDCFGVMTDKVEKTASRHFVIHNETVSEFVDAIERDLKAFAKSTTKVKKPVDILGKTKVTDDFMVL